MSFDTFESMLWKEGEVIRSYIVALKQQNRIKGCISTRNIIDYATV